MTSRRGRRTGAALLLAPLAAGSLALATDWALQHDPLATSGGAQPVSTATSRLQQRAQLAARRLQLSETDLVRLESAVHQRSAQLGYLEAESRAIRQARRTGHAVSLPSGGAVPPGAAAPAPAPVAVPPPPAVNTTTRASGAP